jgi:hypothetical protein
MQSNEVDTEEFDDLFEDVTEKFYAHAYWALEAGVSKDSLLGQLEAAFECVGEPSLEKSLAESDIGRNKWSDEDRVTDDLLMCVCSKACAASLWKRDPKLQKEFASPTLMWDCISAMRKARDTFHSPGAV